MKIFRYKALLASALLFYPMGGLDAAESKKEQKIETEQSSSPLIDAVKERDWQLFSSLADKTTDVNTQDPVDGRTALHWAIVKKENSMIGALIFIKGADLNVQDQGGDTPLHIAVKNDDDDTVRALIYSLANLDIPDNDGNTPLHLAIKKNLWKIAYLLAYSGANPNVSNEEGETALELAIDANKLELIYFLLENGGDVTVIDGNGKTALEHTLAKLDDDTIPIIMALIEYGADASQIDENSVPNKELRDQLDSGIKKWKIQGDGKLATAQKHLTDFKTTYSHNFPNEAFYHIAEALRIMRFEPDSIIAKLTGNPQDDSAFNLDDHLAFIPYAPPFSPIDEIFETMMAMVQAAIAPKKNLGDNALLSMLRGYEKILPYYYKIHLMLPAKKYEGSSLSTAYLVDQSAMLDLIKQLVELYLNNRDFRYDIITFKVMRTPEILHDQDNQAIPFVVIYPRVRPGCAQRVARLLEKTISFPKTDKNYPLIPVPRHNLKFNPDNQRSAIFYAMGDGDLKIDKRVNKLLFDKNVALFNDRIARLAGYHDSLALRPEKKRARYARFDAKEHKKRKVAKLLQKKSDDLP